MDERYCRRKLEGIKQFQEIVNREGSDLIKGVLNEGWFASLKKGIVVYYQKGEREPLDCRYFPYRWLYEEDDWTSVNAGLRKLIASTRKKRVLRRLVQRLASKKWEDGVAAALEISSLIKFLSDGRLVEIAPRINSEHRSHADALIRIAETDILVEVTAITKELVETPPPHEGLKSFLIDTRKQVHQVAKKIEAKIHTQLSVAKSPLILIVSLPPPIGADQETAQCAIEDMFPFARKISAIIVTDTYRFKYGASYINCDAEFELSERETDYISNLLIRTTQLE